MYLELNVPLAFLWAAFLGPAGIIDGLHELNDPRCHLGRRFGINEARTVGRLKRTNMHVMCKALCRVASGHLLI